MPLDSAGALKLGDPKLFRQQCFIDGAWVDADDGSTIEVNNPATGKTLGTVPKMGRGSQRSATRLAFEDRKGARSNPAQVV